MNANSGNADKLSPREPNKLLQAGAGSVALARKDELCSSAKSKYSNLISKLSNLNELKNHKCLLAFSHGVDSTALFYLLAEAEVKFDCAFVNYKTRNQSDAEEAAARELCAKFDKKIFVRVCRLNLEKGANFEARARAVRYEFFDEICAREGYDALIFAHQLNDCFEWFLMQIAKGSGVVNSVGLEAKSKRGEIAVFRPLLDIQKSELLAYLQARGLKYFVDNSNLNEKFTRNHIRARFADAFLGEFGAGVAKSINMFREDKNALLGEFAYERADFFLIARSAGELHLVDKACKRLGVVISAKTRREIQNQISNLKCVVVAHKIAVGANERFVFVAPFLQGLAMGKDFKEKSRLAKIPSLIRPFLYARPEIFADLLSF